MTLDEFLAEQRRTLDAFEKFWRDGMATRPGDFPAESGPGDWDEQLAIFDPS